MRNSRLLGSIIVFGVLLRIGAAIYLGNTVTALPGTADQVSYHTLALRLLEGKGFSFAENWWPITAAGEPTAHWSYIYTLFLAGVYSLVNSQPLAARLIQAVLVGILQPLLAYQLSTKIFDDRVGLFAAAWMAFYGYFIYYAAALMTEPFYITAILATFLITFRLSDELSRQNPGVRPIIFGLGLGVTLGLTVLLRQVFLLVAPILFLWIIWKAHQVSAHKLAAISLVFGLAGLVLLIAPFTVYNYERFGHFVLLNSNAGYAFYLSNHPIHGTEFITARELYSYDHLYPPELLDLDEAALDKALLARGLQFVFDDPIRYLRLSGSRIPIFFNFWPLPGSQLISNVTKVLSFGLMLPFLIYGILRWLSRFSLRRLGALLSEPAALVLASGLMYSLVHIMSWPQVRYRLPVDGMLIPFAAFGLLALLSKFEPGILKQTGFVKSA